MSRKEMDVILRSSLTVFSFRDIELLIRETKPGLLRRRLNYYVKKGELYSPRRGIYTKSKDYNLFEFGVKLYAPAYLSFETVLASSGVVFQRHQTITLASYLSRVLNADGYEYHYRKMTEKIVFNPTGLVAKSGYSAACPERAVLDMLYINIDSSFDNLKGLDRGKLKEISGIYENSRLENKLAVLLRR